MVGLTSPLKVTDYTTEQHTPVYLPGNKSGEKTILSEAHYLPLDLDGSSGKLEEENMYLSCFKLLSNLVLFNWCHTHWENSSWGDIVYYKD